MGWWVRKQLARVDRYRATDTAEKREHARGRCDLARALLVFWEQLRGNVTTPEEIDRRRLAGQGAGPVRTIRHLGGKS